MTKLDLRTLRLAPGDYRREQVTATIAPFTAGAQEYHAEPADVQAKLGLTRLAAREYQADVPEVEDEETTPYLEGEFLDVARWATDSAILALPIVIRCKPDCAGCCSPPDSPSATLPRSMPVPKKKTSKSRRDKRRYQGVPQPIAVGVC